MKLHRDAGTGEFVSKAAADASPETTVSETRVSRDEAARAELETLARICHEANRAWCEFNGDPSQLAWADAPDWQRESARAGVLFHIETPDAGDDASHNAWMRHKLEDGWRYGPTKDPEAKTHPCLVPFAQLPLHQQFKDRLFRTIVHAALAG